MLFKGECKGAGGGDRTTMIHGAKKKHEFFGGKLISIVISKNLQIGSLLTPHFKYLSRENWQLKYLSQENWQSFEAGQAIEL